jgi:2Fe-2S ferredoxin
MTRITFIDPDGSELTVHAEPGVSLMEVARMNGVEGIVADCGGEAACATCHVHIAAGWRERLVPRSDDEADLLEFAKGANEDSRLSCQIVVTDDLEGLEVCIPEEQY